jgi:two-component system OmpR family sensor kinase
VTLRLRLLLALVGLVAAGLLIADTATYLSLRSFMIDRVDQQLLAAGDAVGRLLARGDDAMEGRGQASALLPRGSYSQLRRADGTVVQTLVWTYEGQSQPIPELPSPLPAARRGEPVTFTTNAVDSRTRFRVLVDPVSTGAGATYGYVVVAIPLIEAQQTLSRLLTIELIVTVTVLAGLGALAWWLVRRELRPLDEMAAAAGRIAAGDLSERVAPAERKTEVGRLGLALNAMLEHIELAFAERRASEDRLRRFLADASHELRTPLTSIRGYAEMFHRGAKENPEDLALVMRRIEEEGKRMGVMVDELLLLARLGEGRRPERVPVDLARVVSDAVADARAADQERPLSLDAPAALVVTGDDMQLRQVVANLLGNARAHTPPGTPVRVTLRADAAGPPAAGLDAGGHAVLTVADEGPGMAPDVAAKVFEPFYRADKSRSRQLGGAGLGLAIVAAIVESHGGSVRLDTAPGAGAAFTVTLPLAPAGATRTA